jgi:segregation and condensation protein B
MVEAVLFAAGRAAGPANEIAAHVGRMWTWPRRSRSWRSSIAAAAVELVERGRRWLFQTAPGPRPYPARGAGGATQAQPAAVETLAIIAYHEPVSRAEIEAIRAVSRSPGHAGCADGSRWVRPAGRRECRAAAHLCNDGEGYLA